MRTPATLVLGTVLLATWVFAVPRLGGAPAWSIFYLLHEMPLWVRFAAVLLPAPLAVAGVTALRRLSASSTGHPRLPGWVAPAVAAALALCVFWTFRESRHWGDADVTVAILENRAPVPALGRWFWREPLDRLIAMSVSGLMERIAGAGAETAVALVSCVAGAGFVALLVLLARLMARETGTRVFVCAFVLSMGASQLFFGHVENYTLVTTSMLGFFLVCARVLAGRGRLWGAWLAAAVTVTVHAQGAFLIAPLVALVASQRGRAWRTVRGLAGSLLPGIAYLLGFYAACRWLGAPPIEVGANRYAGQAGVVLGLGDALAERHLWNVLQGYALTVPFGVCVVLAGSLASREGRATWRDPMLRVLAAACVSFGVFNLFFDAQLARRQDWSLFAPAALPVALLGARSLALRLEAGRSSPAVAAFVVLLSLGLSLPWIASNHLAQSRPASATIDASAARAADYAGAAVPRGISDRGRADGRGPGAAAGRGAPLRRPGSRLRLRRPQLRRAAQLHPARPLDVGARNR